MGENLRADTIKNQYLCYNNQQKLFFLIQVISQLSVSMILAKFKKCKYIHKDKVCLIESVKFNTNSLIRGYLSLLHCGFFAGVNRIVNCGFCFSVLFCGFSSLINFPINFLYFICNFYVAIADSLEKSGEDNGEQDQKHKHGKRSKKEHDSTGQSRKFQFFRCPWLKPTKKKKNKMGEIKVPDQQHVMFSLGEQHADDEPRQSPAFVELDELYTDPTSGNPPEWREVARWFHISSSCFFPILFVDTKIPSNLSTFLYPTKRNVVSIDKLTFSGEPCFEYFRDWPALSLVFTYICRLYASPGRHIWADLKSKEKKDLTPLVAKMQVTWAAKSELGSVNDPYRLSPSWKLPFEGILFFAKVEMGHKFRAYFTALPLKLSLKSGHMNIKEAVRKQKVSREA
ncbi:hypothetical protein EGR_08032 [Echinococcus granulosus]|uniref:Uncharacterized protein n=1 Tax=Echinococcus granulosus TaxID=6210 RepID=W6UUL5_ECHGR|nr:hypothetical protein EGR_08032 [Echinococcus granulosus]EUB57084.1 hypothetical protein EGR_08032 [Echinococcus granulosus]